MLKTISPLADRIVLTRPRSERAVDPKTLAGLDFLKGKDVTVVPDIPSAWTTALRSAGRRDLICCTGSMYFVGELLKILE
jgi:dihydrofolate synthase/folylpolyglutamate synthase